MSEGPSPRVVHVRWPETPLVCGDVRLRELTFDDAGAVAAAYGDPEILRWTARRTVPHTREEIVAWIGRRLSDAASGLSLYFAVVDPVDDRLLGGASLGTTNTQDAATMGYWVVAHERGRGVATTALRLLCRHAEDLGFARAVLWIRDGNVISDAVARRTGFVPYGFDHKVALVTGEDATPVERYERVLTSAR